VSWLRSFFDNLFGRQSEPLPIEKSSKNSSKGNKTTTPKRKFDNNVPYSEESVAYVLKHSAQLKPDMHLYDLNAPPALDKTTREHLLARITKIPPMPEIWHRIQQVLQQDDASTSELGQCVAQDPVLTAHILKMCNSAAYVVPGGVEISNIRLAIARLGLDEASSIIFRVLAPDLGASEQSKREVRHVWFHSQAISILSRILVEPARQVSRHDATLIGMLHDIGKLVILHIEDEHTLDQLKALIDQGMPTLAAEQKALAYTHIDAGMMLALHWKLPALVRNAISFHHHPTVQKAECLPQDLQHTMLSLHTAHLILQHVLQQELMTEGEAAAAYIEAGNAETDQSEADILHDSIWLSARRSCLHETPQFVQQEMSIPLESESLYRQIVAEIKRLKLSFPDLFASKP